MRSQLRINRLLPLLMLIALLTASVIQAQDATVEATPAATIEAAGSVEPVAGVDSSGGISTTGLALGVLLLGLGAVAMVGGLNWLRDNYKRPEESS